MLRLGWQLHSRAAQPLIHLRHLNPHLGATLELAAAASPSGGGPPVLLPRQAAPWALPGADAGPSAGAGGASYEQRAAGVSAFAFQVPGVDGGCAGMHTEAAEIRWVARPHLMSRVSWAKALQCCVIGGQGRVDGVRQVDGNQSREGAG